MVKVDTELRDKLISSGKWADFVSACEECEASGERRKARILAYAMEKVGEGVDEYTIFKNSPKPKPPKKRAPDVVARTARCNAFQMLEWVVENFERDGVEEFDAPSRATWAVLKASRGDGDVYRDVLKKYLDSKIKQDTAAGDTDARKIDGQEQYDILEGLIAGDFS